MQSELLDVGPTRLHVRRWGPPDGRPLLFLHSLGPAASGAMVGVGVTPLADAGWSIAAPDMPGFGQSPTAEPDGYTTQRLAALAWSIADRLGWDRLVLGGHSWGGANAIHAAAARPERVRALILVDSGHLDYADTPGARLDESLEQLIEQIEAGRHRAADRAGVAADLELPIDDPVVDAFMEGITDDGAGGLITRTQGIARGPAMYHLARAKVTTQWPAIAAAGIPTLLLLATEPAATRATNAEAAARFQAAIPHADVRFVEGATHSVITDERERFGETVRDWLASLD
jgi:pimeloyl-ACP methyl ester carboxylesterase